MSSNSKQQEEEEEAEVSWDDICVNPHEEYLQQGREQGREAGLASGYKNGYQLGKQKAIEFGMELGFIRGFLSVIAADVRLERTERIATHMNELRTMMDAFESSTNEMFPSSRSGSGSEISEDGIDISAKMQRIRAKFKLITVQLNLKQFSLKHVMQDASEQGKLSDGSNDTTVGKGVSTDW